MPLLFLAIPVLSTLAGGLLAVRFRRFLPVLTAAGAGLLLGSAFLDLLPEALELGARVRMNGTAVLGLTLVFFLGSAGFESLLDFRGRAGAGGLTEGWGLGRFAGGMMIFHSFRDGMAIGAAFGVSHAAGCAVTLGVVAHDVGDGMNTILLTTGGRAPRRVDWWFLVADAVAPFAGGLLTVWWLVSSRSAVVLLAFTAGCFLQMADPGFSAGGERGFSEAWGAPGRGRRGCGRDLGRESAVETLAGNAGRFTSFEFAKQDVGIGAAFCW